MISVLILTKNEAQDLPGCLDSVAWSDDVHVFDSHSTDETVAIAQSAGAKVATRKFDGYASQRNAALNTLNFLHPWILILDADERIPPALPQVLRDNIENAPPGTAGFRLRRRDYLHGTWLKHSQISPFFIRLVARGKAQYHREINEVLEVDGSIVEIEDYFDHYPFSKGMRHWLEKHNVYSTMEAQRWLDEQDGQIGFSLKKALFAKDFNEKRFHQKGLFYKMPGRPLLKWGYMMFYCGGILDGRAGWTYAMLQAIYEYFIVVKSREFQATAR
ncbi:MAG: glycosyltransferase family 2 protein [Lewinella sp.]